MDDVTRYLLNAIGAANGQMIALAATFRRQPGVVRVHHELDWRQASESNQILLNIVVDAELTHGPGLVCEIDGWWTPDWGVAASIRFVLGDDSEDVQRFPARRSSDSVEFIADLAEIATALVAAAEHLDVAEFLVRWPGVQPQP